MKSASLASLDPAAGSGAVHRRAEVWLEFRVSSPAAVKTPMRNDSETDYLGISQ